MERRATIQGQRLTSRVLILLLSCIYLLFSVLVSSLNRLFIFVLKAFEKFMKLYVVILLFILPALCFASDEATQNTIIITSSRGAEPVEEKVAAVTVIDQEDILRSGASNVTEVLRGQAGIAITDLYGDGSQSTVDMRGFGARADSNTLILVDGRRLNNPDLSSPNLNSISLKNIERIEIIEGSAGTLYGDQAVGGVVNIITRPVEHFSAEISSLLGSYNRRGISASINDRYEQSYVRAFIEILKSDNYRDNNKLDAEHLFSRLGHNFANTEVFFELQVDADKQQYPGALLADEAEENPRQSLEAFKNDFSDTNEQLYRLGVEQELGSQWKFLAEYSQRQQDTDFILNFRSCIDFSACNTTADEEERTVKSFTPRISGSIPLGEENIHLTVGADLEDTEYEINTTFTDRSNDQKVNSYYLHAVIPLSQDWTLTTGGRYSKVKNKLFDNVTYATGDNINDKATVYNVGIAKQFSGVRVFARFDENFRFTKVDELANAVISVPLESQLGNSKELGVDFQLPSASLQLLAYELDLENEIAYDPTANGIFGPFGANINFESTRRRGVSVDYVQGLTDSLELRLNVSRIEAEFTSDGEFGSNIVKGNSISGVPELLGFLALDYQILDSWSVLLETNYVGEQYLSGDNANNLDKKDAYSVSNIATRYEISNWVFNARINNLFDKRYSEVENSNGAVNPSPERNILVSATYNF